jgi:type IV pilus assembly protein PilA
MLHKLRSRAQDEKGFTLIELLVVILIIGILAAIALPAFLNQREKAQDTEAKSNIRTAQTALETHYTDTQKYSTGDEAALTLIEPALKDPFKDVASGGNDLTVTGAADESGYTITGESKGKNSVIYTLESDATGITRSCAPVGKGGCKADGSW